VHISYALGFALVPIALYVPAPTALVRRAAFVGFLLLGLSLLLVVSAGVLIVSLDDAYPGIALALLSISVFVLMLWTAGTPRRRPPDDGEDGGGGGGRGPIRPPEPPKAPDGLGLDWNDFDRLRNEWAADREVLR
jgi:hypothetical protein